MNNIKQEILKIYNDVHLKNPVIHNITNAVTINDCANVQLAVGGSPIMADDIGEVEDIVNIASCLVINIGTLNERTIQSMLLAGKSANSKGIPVIFDPVGAGASRLRDSTIKRILSDINVSVIKGNLGEIASIAGVQVCSKGVDSSLDEDSVNSIDIAKQVARTYKCVVGATGAVDIVTDGEKTITLHNGNSMMEKITGTGCMATALVGAYAGVSECKLIGTVGALGMLGVAGDIALEKSGNLGTASLRTALIDALSIIKEQELSERLVMNEK